MKLQHAHLLVLCGSMVWLPLRRRRLNGRRLAMVLLTLLIVIPMLAIGWVLYVVHMSEEVPGDRPAATSRL